MIDDQCFVKMVNHFLSKSSKFCILWTIRFVQISPACGPNTYQKLYVRDFRFPMSASAIYGNIKYPIGKSIFAVHLLYTVANADIGSLKFL